MACTQASWHSGASENRYGTRFWFACPRCGRRVGKLYVPPGRHKALCRHCHRLRYLAHHIKSTGNYGHWQAYWLHRWEKANGRLERGYLRGRKKDFWTVKRWEAGKNLFREGILRWDGRRRKAFQVVTLHDLLTRSPKPRKNPASKEAGYTAGYTVAANPLIGNSV